MKTVREEFGQMMQYAYPDGCSEAQRVDMRRSFYAGVLVTLNLCADIANDKLPVSAIDEWDKEVREFVRPLIDAYRRGR